MSLNNGYGIEEVKFCSSYFVAEVRNQQAEASQMDLLGPQYQHKNRVYRGNELDSQNRSAQLRGQAGNRIFFYRLQCLLGYSAQ